LACGAFAACKRGTIEAVTADRISPSLYQGSKPPEGAYLRDHGFKVLVLSAMEHQPPASAFPGVRVLHCPLDDDPSGIPPKEWTAAVKCSKAVTKAVKRGERTLVTCAEGRNRSGLIVALALWAADRHPRHAGRVKARRARALTNPAFVEAIGRLL